ncbi:VOC family protein [Streptomyces griseoaurantiacus]|uniref:VOC family protein n=1 Tax=Streptomyces griseoaurantiacus TaxID=68213 RepID=UPI00381AB1D3
MLSTRYVSGAPNWLDLGAPDIDGAAAFYAALFGWQFGPAGPGAGGYGFFRLTEKTVAGGMPITPEQGPPSWNVYFQVPDAGATAQAVEQAGGRVLVPPMDVMGEGTMAVFADRAGAAFGVWQPGRLKGLDAAGTLGALCWVELHTADVPASAAFYHRVLGWEVEGVPFPGDTTYTCVNPAEGGPDGMFGGLVAKGEDPLASETRETGPGAAPDAYWLPYFAVADADAVASRAAEEGGTVLLPPTDVPDVGRLARLTDPYGARFALLRPAPRQG